MKIDGRSTEHPSDQPIRCDLCVLGSGPAGQNVAVKLAREGWSVVVVESRELGGTCALRGCNPKKVFSNAARLFDAVDHVRGLMTDALAPLIQWPMIQEFQRQFTDPVPESTADKFNDCGIDWLIGDAKFQSDRTLAVDGHTIDATYFVIATGAKPSRLPFDGREHLTTSDEIFGLETMPPRVLFVGGGYISMEFAHVARRCGSDVTVVQRSKQILPHFDPDHTELLSQYSRDAGIEILLEHEIISIEERGDAFRVKITDGKGQESEIEVDRVFHGAGRTASVETLQLDRIGIEVGDGGVKINDDNACTGAERMFAVGDCADTGLAHLTPTASMEGKRLVEYLKAVRDGCEPPPRKPAVVTAVAFTPVPIASCGLSQSEAEQQCERLQINQRDTSTWGSVRKTGQTCAAYKILIDRDRDVVVGAHLLGPGSDEQINLFALAITHRLPIDEVKRTLFGYPTMGDDISRML